MRHRNDKLDKVIGENLRRARRKRGLTQQELAALVHIAYQQIQKYEDGLAQIPLAMAYRLVSHLDIAADTLFAGLDGTKPAAGDDRDVYRMSRAFQRIKSQRTRDVVVAMVNQLAEVG
jgi:transcriptional regulator with XRE-family HTH domain